MASSIPAHRDIHWRHRVRVRYSPRHPSRRAEPHKAAQQRRAKPLPGPAPPRLAPGHPGHHDPNLTLTGPPYNHPLARPRARTASPTQRSSDSAAAARSSHAIASPCGAAQQARGELPFPNLAFIRSGGRHGVPPPPLSARTASPSTRCAAPAHTCRPRAPGQLDAEGARGGQGGLWEAGGGRGREGGGGGALTLSEGRWTR